MMRGRGILGRGVDRALGRRALISLPRVRDRARGSAAGGERVA